EARSTRSNERELGRWGRQRRVNPGLMPLHKHQRSPHARDNKANPSETFASHPVRLARRQSFLTTLVGRGFSHDILYFDSDVSDVVHATSWILSQAAVEKLV